MSTVQFIAMAMLAMWPMLGVAAKEIIVHNTNASEPYIPSSIQPSLELSTNAMFTVQSTDIHTTNITSTPHSKQHESLVFGPITLQYIILISFVLCLTSLIFGTTCYKFAAQKNKQKFALKPVQAVALIVMFTYLLSYLFWFISIFYDHLVIEICEHLCFALGWFSLYVLMFYRLYHTFSDSEYRMGKLHICVHAMVAALIPVWYAGLFVVQHVWRVRELDTPNSYWYIAGLCSLVTLVGLSLLIATFNKNLFKAVLVQKISKNLESLNHSHLQRELTHHDQIDAYGDESTLVMEDEDDEDDEEQRTADEVEIESLLSVITKQTLLGSIMTAGMFMFVLTIVALIMAKSNRRSIVWIIYEWCLGFVVVVNCLCIFLAFKMNEKEYTFFFQSCHHRLLWSYKKMALKAQITEESKNDSQLNVASAHADLSEDTNYFMHDND